MCVCVDMYKWKFDLFLPLRVAINLVIMLKILIINLAIMLKILITTCQVSLGWARPELDPIGSSYQKFDQQTTRYMGQTQRFESSVERVGFFE